MSLGSCLATDELTVLLGLVAASTFLLKNLYKPQPLVHPVLLGRQSDASQVRQAGESAIYRNYGTGMMGRLPLRPAKDISVLGDFVRPDQDTPRTLWSTRITNQELKARVAALGTGLIRQAGLSQDSKVLLLLNDSLEFVITDLALAAHGIPSFTLSSASLLSKALDSHPPDVIITNASFVPQVIEHIFDSAEHEHHTLIVLGDVAKPQDVEGINVLTWDEIERQGGQISPIVPPNREAQSTFSVSFFESPNGGLQAAHLTHENVTAGVAATRVLLPLASAISHLDTIVSSHSLSTAYGRAIAYTAIFEGCSFATTDSTKILNQTTASTADLTSSFSTYPIPSPTILFITPTHFKSTWTDIASVAKGSFLASLAYRHKISALAEGFISKDGLWDRTVFDAARAKVIGEGAGTVRAVIVTGKDLPAKDLPDARVTLSIPVVHAVFHPAVVAPVCATHPLDLQHFPAPSNAQGFDAVAHAGPPTVNLEAKLVGIDDAATQAGQDPEGTLLVRGPTVAKVEIIGDEPSAELESGWLNTWDRVRVLTNGCFKFLP